MAVLRASIIEHTQDIDSNNEGTVGTPEFKTFITKLLTDYDGELMIEVADDARYVNIPRNVNFCY